jgi:hypothetical protein
MAIPVSFKPLDKRFLGNSSPSHKEVHDLYKEKSQCQITKIIKAGHAVVFKPDTLTQAHSEGYDNCAYCIGGSQR